MQNTRLNAFVETTSGRIGQVFQNPWRRISLLVICLLFGFFLGNAISTSAGQRAELDIVAALLLALLTEGISRLNYSGSRLFRRSLPMEGLNALKLGLIYALFLEAFKLGS
jgi:hypothetical protein